MIYYFRRDLNDILKWPTFSQINIFSKLENYPKVLQKKISLKYKLSTHFEKSNKKSKQSRHFRKIFCWLTIQMPWLLLLLTPFHMLICSSNLFLEAFRSCWVGVRVFSKACCQKKTTKQLRNLCISTSKKSEFNTFADRMNLNWCRNRWWSEKVKFLIHKVGQYLYVAWSPSFQYYYIHLMRIEMKNNFDFIPQSAMDILMALRVSDLSVEISDHA